MNLATLLLIERLLILAKMYEHLALLPNAILSASLRAFALTFIRPVIRSTMTKANIAPTTPERGAKKAPAMRLSSKKYLFILLRFAITTWTMGSSFTLRNLTQYRSISPLLNRGGEGLSLPPRSINSILGLLHSLDYYFRHS